jgi:hypothetical protein
MKQIPFNCTGPHHWALHDLRVSLLYAVCNNSLSPVYVGHLVQCSVNGRLGATTLQYDDHVLEPV